MMIIIMQSFKLVINQVWTNRCKKFIEWEQLQNIDKKKGKFYLNR